LLIDSINSLCDITAKIVSQSIKVMILIIAATIEQAIIVIELD
jgi:hypothetical protein